MSIAPYKFIDELRPDQLAQVMNKLKNSDSAYFGQDVDRLLATFGLSKNRDELFFMEIMDRGSMAASFFPDHWFGQWARAEIPYWVKIPKPTILP